jgi:hypothetical protein
LLIYLLILPYIHHKTSASISEPQENIVSKIALEKFKYEKLFADQAVELKKDPANCERAYERVSRSMNTVKPGQEWIPKPTDKEAYMQQMDSICQKEPTSLDDSGFYG